MTQGKGVCPVCFTSVRLREETYCQPHRCFMAGGSGCAGEGQVAKDDLTTRQERVVDLIEATIRATNTSKMSDANSRRTALAVFWSLHDHDRWLLIPR